MSENPLSGLIWRNQTRAGQWGLLSAGLIVLCALTFLLKNNLTTRPQMLPYLLFRMAVVEFFWIWMAADHLVSTTMRWRKQGAFDELQLTSLTPTEIAEGFPGPAVAFLCLAHTLHCLLDGLQPYGVLRGIGSTSGLVGSVWSDAIVWRIGLSAGLWFSGFATILVAALWSYHAAVTCRPEEVHISWFVTLCRCGIVVGVMDLGGYLTGAGLMALVNLGMEIYRNRIASLDPSVVVGCSLILGTGMAGLLKISFVAVLLWKQTVKAVQHYVERQSQ